MQLLNKQVSSQFLTICHAVAEKLGLREVPKEEIERRVQLSEEEYLKTLKQLERKIC